MDTQVITAAVVVQEMRGTAADLRVHDVIMHKGDHLTLTAGPELTRMWGQKVDRWTARGPEGDRVTVNLNGDRRVRFTYWRPVARKGA